MSRRRSYVANGVLLFVSLLVALALGAPPARGDDGPPEYREQGDLYLPLVFRIGRGPDADGDGFLDGEDGCPHSPPGWVVNEAGCSIPDLCPCYDDAWEELDDFVSCLEQTGEDFVAAGLITEEEKADLLSQAAGSPCGPPPVGDCDSCDWGTPTWPVYWLYPNYVINFAVAGDPQMGNMFHTINKWIPNDDLLASQVTADEIREHCYALDPACIGLIMVGDLTNDRECDSMLAYRQIFEYRYDESPDRGCMDDSDVHGDWHDTSYSWGHTVDRPMFPLLGNHDDQTEFGETNVRRYVHEIMGHSPAIYQYPIEQRAIDPNLPPSYYAGNYAWEWGGFHFLSLGLWAFYGGWREVCGPGCPCQWMDPFHDIHTCDCDDACGAHCPEKCHGIRDRVDESKVTWLRQHLETIGKEKPIILSQHFGWDGFSFNGNWWTRDNADMLVKLPGHRPGLLKEM